MNLRDYQVSAVDAIFEKWKARASELPAATPAAEKAPAPDAKKAMNKAEFARRAGVSVTTPEGLLRAGEVSCVRIGGRVLFRESQLEELLARYENSASKPTRKTVIRKYTTPRHHMDAD